ncbi:isochorismate synthase [Flavobacteriaceae bacterium]|nr:isochorismate synthase [Flavobacteriaceae bacterium]
MNHLSETIRNHIRAHWPMLCFLKPNAQEIEFWFSHGQTLQNLSTGPKFYVQGFNPEEPMHIWSGDSFDCSQFNLKDLEQHFAHQPLNLAPSWSAPDQDQARLAYEGIIQRAVDSIQKGMMSKVVLSRVKGVYAPEVDWLYLIWRLIHVDQNAFRYLMVHPDLGIWCGATPELLISSKEDQFSTMALAGTRWLEGEEFPEWTEKEFEEHHWVVREILTSLKPFASASQQEPCDHQAGSIQHLRTDITGSIRAPYEVLDLARSLHPTPAVCGFPKKTALDFITANEGYNRGLYTGYLGFVRPEAQRAEFYVNLRCMQFLDDRFELFVGGGVTQDSDPNKEWIETQRKMATMGQVIAPFIEQR